MKIPFRIRLFAGHLGFSALLLGIVLGAFYAGWYYWPNWYLMGAGTVVGLMVLVDVGLGPLATFIVSNPAKPARQLRRDIAVIVLLQLAALAYGSYTLWLKRPLFYVFSEGGVEIVPAAAFESQDVEEARIAGIDLLPGATRLPTWVWAPLPSDTAEAHAIISQVLTTGKDIVSVPKYFQPIEKAKPLIFKHLQPLGVLRGKYGFSEQDYDMALARLGRTHNELGYLPVQAQERDGSIIFDRQTLQAVDFWPVVVWPKNTGAP